MLSRPNPQTGSGTHSVKNYTQYDLFKPQSLICPANSLGPGQVLALRAHCVHTAHAEAGILTQEYLSPV